MRFTRPGRRSAMLSRAQLDAMIAAEFLRVGASQQSWDQNFPQAPSTWVPSPTGPVLSDESRETYLEIASKAAIGSTAPVPELVCPPGTVKEFVNGRWQCTAVGGRVADPEGELYPPPGGGAQRPGALMPSGALPRFIGGSLGKVVYTSISNRNLNGIRMGVLPRVVMGDVAPSSYASQPGVDDAAGDFGSGGGGLIEP